MRGPWYTELGSTVFKSPTSKTAPDHFYNFFGTLAIITYNLAFILFPGLFCLYLQQLPELQVSLSLHQVQQFPKNTHYCEFDDN